MSPNTVAKVLDASGVRYERTLHGFEVGNLRLMSGGGIAGRSGEWFIRSIRGPEIRTRMVTSQRTLRALICDYFPRWVAAKHRNRFGDADIERILHPRRLKADGTERKDT